MCQEVFLGFCIMFQCPSLTQARITILFVHINDVLIIFVIGKVVIHFDVMLQFIDLASDGGFVS